MRVREIMTENPVYGVRETNLQEIAQMMVEYDCGSIPVVENQNTLRPIGVVTDRDIVCRIVAEGLNPLEMTASDCMSSPVVTVTPETSVEECGQLMENHQVRRIPVVDQNGSICGMVAQADLALNAPKQVTVEVIQEVSEPNY
jgi:CBS domain-containing protein